ncbi:glutaredoxin family protein [Candidatus Kaiserbacteria bacterium]|nr:glutaredoxin family protein [Candidatus Kaiserbacteria bacterium]
MPTQPQVTIYTTPTCHFCGEAKGFFQEHKVAYTEHNVATDLAKRKEMIEKSGQMGVPVIYVGDQLVVGYDQDKLKQFLSIQ